MTRLNRQTPNPPLRRASVTSHGSDVLTQPHLSPLPSHRSPLTSHLSPLTSHLSPLTSHLSPLTSHLSPLTSHISHLTSHGQFSAASLNRGEFFQIDALDPFLQFLGILILQLDLKKVAL